MLNQCDIRGAQLQPIVDIVQIVRLLLDGYFTIESSVLVMLDQHLSLNVHIE